MFRYFEVVIHKTSIKMHDDIYVVVVVQGSRQSHTNYKKDPRSMYNLFIKTNLEKIEAAT